MNNNESKKDFFISFKSHDGEVYVEWLKKLLDAGNYSYVSMDNFDPGIDFEKQINIIFGTTRGTIAVVTKKYFENYETDDWCFKEFSAAYHKHEKNNGYSFIPVRFEEVADDSIPATFGRTNYTDLYKCATDEEKAKELLRRLKKVTATTPNAPPKFVDIAKSEIPIGKKVAIPNVLPESNLPTRKKNTKSYQIVIFIILAIITLSIYGFTQIRGKINLNARVKKISKSNPIPTKVIIRKKNTKSYQRVINKIHRIQPNPPAEPPPRSTPISVSHSIKSSPRTVVAYVPRPVLPPPTIPTLKVDISGNWIGFFTKSTSSGKTKLIPFTMDIHENGDKISGTMKNKMFGGVHRADITGTIIGSDISFTTMYTFTTSKYVFSGKIAKNRVKGKGTWKYYFENGRWLIARPNSGSKIVKKYNELKNAKKNSKTSNYNVHIHWGSVFRNLFK